MKLFKKSHDGGPTSGVTNMVVPMHTNLLHKWKRNVVYGAIIGGIGVYLAGPSGMVAGGTLHAMYYVIDKKFLC